VLLSDEQSNGHYAALLSVEEKYKLGIFDSYFTENFNH
jgi:hypothetical protein